MNIKIPIWVIELIWFWFWIAVFAAVPFYCQYLHLYGPDWIYGMASVKEKTEGFAETVTNWPLVLVCVCCWVMCILALVAPFAPKK